MSAGDKGGDCILTIPFLYLYREIYITPALNSRKPSERRIRVQARRENAALLGGMQVWVTQYEYEFFERIFYCWVPK